LKQANKLIAFTFAGGFIGTAARYLLGGIPDIAFVNFWVVNLSGAIAIALFNEFAWFKTSERRAFFVTGFAGGFTTMSGLSMMLFYAWDQVLIQVLAGVAVYLFTGYLVRRFSRV
jgi:fluoride ion exporter CrcB/FEX